MSAPLKLRASSLDEYKRMINEALDDIDELRASIEYDEEFMADAAAILDQLDKGVKTLLSSIEDGTYEFGKGEELSFMSLVRNSHESALPFKHLLGRIDATHREGLDT